VDVAGSRLEAYLAALLEANRRVNLTAARDPDRARDVLVRPSLALGAAWGRSRPPHLVVDVGSGNGFPGVAAAALWPGCHVVLVERRGRKARALVGCLEAAGLAGVEVLALDAREIPRQRPDLCGRADLVTLRAVGSVAEGNRLAAPLLGPGGLVVHWKRPTQAEVEGREARAAAARLGLVRCPDVPHGGGAAVLVVYERGEAAR
jgi:16S rRNA (guanine527-N7)-methyltransferase